MDRGKSFLGPGGRMCAQISSIGLTQLKEGFGVWWSGFATPPHPKTSPKCVTPNLLVPNKPESIQGEKNRCILIWIGIYSVNYSLEYLR